MSQNVTLDGPPQYFGICERCSNGNETRDAFGAPLSEPTTHTNGDAHLHIHSDTHGDTNSDHHIHTGVDSDTDTCSDRNS